MDDLGVMVCDLKPMDRVMSLGFSGISSLVAQRSFSQNSANLFASLKQLSTGKRINRGKDDPAGLITSSNLQMVLAQLDAETRAIHRVESIGRTADGALSEVRDLLVEAKGLAVASANEGGLSEGERAANQLQMDSILSSVDRIGRTTTFGGRSLLDGTAEFSAAGAELSIGAVNTGSLGEAMVDGELRRLSDVKSGGALSTVGENGAGAVEVIDAAIGDIAEQRAVIGSFEKQAGESLMNRIAVTIENVSAANSSLVDTDFAQSTSGLIRLQLLELASLKLMLKADEGAGRILDLLG